MLGYNITLNRNFWFSYFCVSCSPTQPISHTFDVLSHFEQTMFLDSQSPSSKIVSIPEICWFKCFVFSDSETRSKWVLSELEGIAHPPH